MSKIKQTYKKVKRKVRKSKKTAKITKDLKGRNHCSACGAFVSK